MSSSLRFASPHLAVVYAGDVRNAIAIGNMGYDPTATVDFVPEPSSIALLMTCLLALGLVAITRRAEGGKRDAGS